MNKTRELVLPDLFPLTCYLLLFTYYLLPFTEAGEELPEGREMKRAEPVKVEEDGEVVMVELDKVGEVGEAK
jgi:hypothetical protein